MSDMTERPSAERLAEIRRYVNSLDSAYAFSHSEASRLLGFAQLMSDELDAVRADMQGVIEGNAQGAISARNAIHRLLDAADVAPHADYHVRIVSLIRERDEARKALDWITDRARDAHGPVGFSVNEDGDILVMSWSAEGLRGDAGETAADAIAAAFGDG